MDIKIYNNAEEIGCAAAQLYKELINSNPSAVLGLATGATPVPTYKKLIELYKNGEISFKDVTTFNLDEYCDLDKHDKNSYYTFMHENLFNYIDIKEENVNFLDGNAKDCDAESKRYAEAIRAAVQLDRRQPCGRARRHARFRRGQRCEPRRRLFHHDDVQRRDDKPERQPYRAAQNAHRDTGPRKGR